MGDTQTDAMHLARTHSPHAHTSIELRTKSSPCRGDPMSVIYKLSIMCVRSPIGVQNLYNAHGRACVRRAVRQSGTPQTQPEHHSRRQRAARPRNWVSGERVRWMDGLGDWVRASATGTRVTAVSDARENTAMRRCISE